MQTLQFLHAALAEALPTIHARRLEALMAAVAALLQDRCLTLAALGRSAPTKRLVMVTIFCNFGASSKYQRGG
ncbi:hypothetical protein GCM10027398_21680 [Azotobacter salinestris]